MRISTTTVLSTLAIVATVPMASALTLRAPLQPIQLGSSSSASTMPLLKPLYLSSASSSSSSSSAVTANPEGPKSTTKPQKDPNLMQYCQGIAITLLKGENVTITGEDAAKFNMSIDMLKKANALCAAMGYELMMTGSEGSFSSSSTSVVFMSGTFSTSSSSLSWNSQGSFSSSSTATVVTTSELKYCKNLGKTTTRSGVSYCKYQCGTSTKVAKCPSR